MMMSIRGLREVRSLIQEAHHIVVITGAGVSAESGIPTFRGPGGGGLWQEYDDPTRLATPEAFAANPSLVWEFYEYRRKVVAAASPNTCHMWCAELQKIKENDGKDFTLMTQNVDRLHQAAGSHNIIELHGSLWLVKKSSDAAHTHTFIEDGVNVWEDRNVPITPAFANIDQPPDHHHHITVPIGELPHRDGRLLRPAVVWFGEALDKDTLASANKAMSSCDLLLVLGTSSVVYPAAGFADTALKRNIPRQSYL
ncbi:NAD-dependent deacetylase sirtuin-5, putative [Perkinsus marinus ATCC 50983]|uniref:NAD-dependent deacetylase sirtuin-5, putative n=1 Tax=Perkinsus marinus (strain ATCC 50983 / TXsc) TaxID=423536 RepID=C5L233_PERM5|nr:NAD-dependent deacetylase sirtuin-5, putative [Perkinsus marinus ATCC 50983]EER09226.1 NAD-dependent deacetylase sirtuin-5, putative [Perkinsus marinus ATCC 50983]|eukprot:XP_002777410.1 NAD-dependent deacetylase sirtuin-5, putative [Perkinsus marinus ATCC 50983]